MKLLLKTILLSNFFVFLLSTSIFISCSSFNLYPPSEDIKIGTNVDKQIKSNPKEYPMLQDSKVKAYLEGILAEILKSKYIEYKNVFKYKIDVIDNDNVVNAFCIPGGIIYVYTGLLKFVDNEATLAAVIAHEIAHAERRHTTSRMSKAYGMDLLYDAVKTETGAGKYGDMAKDLFSGLGLLYNTRENEIEADEYAFKYLQSTKWFPGALNFFFEKIYALVETKQKTSVLDNLLATHPVSNERFEAITAMLKKNNVPPPTEANLFTRSYQEFKNNNGF